MKVCRSRSLVMACMLPRLLKKLGVMLFHAKKHILWIARDEQRIWCVLCNKTLLRKSWKGGKAA